jgi:hypothetical protein
MMIGEDRVKKQGLTAHSQNEKMAAKGERGCP